MMRIMIALVGDAIVFSALSMAWGWTVWKRIIPNPIARNAVSVTTGWVTGVTIWMAVLMVTAVNFSWVRWAAFRFFLISYAPILAAAILLGIYRRRKNLASEIPYGEIFE